MKTIFSKKIFSLSIALLFLSISFSQTRPDSTEIHNSSINNKKLLLVAGTHAAFWTGSYIALNKAWYADYPKTSFHFFNDFKEWKQMDKAGHVWTTYHLNSISAELWKWTGLKENKSVLLGGLSAMAYQSIIEIQDGYSAKWGFSWTDMAANITGVAAYAGQQLAWKEQRIQIKMSFFPYDYSSGLLARRNELFGKSLTERFLKDYNSQTYWASINLRSFFKQSRFPSWLNISFGYGANGLLGGTENRWTDKNGTNFDRTDIERNRQFFISPDIDLTKIKTKSRFIRSVLFIANAIKVPAPAIELSNSRIKGHWLYF